MRKIAIVGSGPAGLMAAFVVASRLHEISGHDDVVIFERRRGPGRKLLIAGSSGLNITYDAPPDAFAAHYEAPNGREEVIAQALQKFGPADWIAFIEALGISTFKGTSRRYFVEGMKASALLRAWLAKLAELGVRIEYGREFVGFEKLASGKVKLSFAEGPAFEADAACLALGGGSYETEELRWPRAFAERGVEFTEFQASNVGFQVQWPEALLKEAEGKPIKNVVLTSARASRSGDLVITQYGVEGTPVYFAGMEGEVELDLKPDLTEAQVSAKLRMSRENLSPIRRIKRFLNLGEGALALLFHMTPKEELTDLSAMIARIKRFRLKLEARQPLSEAISSSGGVSLGELDGALMLRRYPAIFLAGEMLEWDAPTGGFLIQGSVSLGHAAGRGILEYLASIK